MAFSQIPTCFSLNRVAEFFRISPFVFNDIDISNCVPEFTVDRRCSQIAQYRWQGSGYLAMEDFAYYLSLAESIVQRYLPYNICNGFTTEIIELPTHYSGRYKPYFHKGMRLITETKCISEFGVPVCERLALSKFVLRYGSQTDNFKEKFRASFTIPGNFDLANFEYIYVTHPGSNGKRHQRLSVKVESFDQNTRLLVVTGHVYDLIKLSYTFDESVLRTRSLDLCADEDVFEKQLELWVERANTCLPYANLICDKICVDCATEKHPVCLGIVDCDDGIVEIRGYGRLDENGCFVESACPPCINNCSRLEISMRSGCSCGCNAAFDCDLGHPSCPMIERAVMLVMADLLPATECGCSQVIEQLERYQTDVSRRTSSDSYNIPFEMLDNPIGTTKAAVTAWKIIEDLQGSSCERPIGWTRNI